VPRTGLIQHRPRLTYPAGSQEEQGEDNDKHRRRDRKDQAGREARRCVTPGDHARPGRYIGGLDKTVPLHGQRPRRAAPGVPRGAPARDRRDRADDADTMRGELRGRCRLGGHIAGALIHAPEADPVA